MKSIIASILCFSFCISTLIAQIPLTVAPSGGNKKAVVGEQIGLTKVLINYDRPGVKGREGKIWGQLVHTGFTDQGFGNSKQAPWRAGANENTTIEFSTDVKINGQALPAGKYGLFLAYYPEESILIFSKNSSSWGSYYYSEKEDALRVKVKPQPLEKTVEWLKYEFLNQTENSATVALSWEKQMIPFNIEVDYVKDQLESFRKELRTEKGFIWESWQQAAAWCLQRNVNLEQALQWADSASAPTFGGDKEFQTHATKAQILDKLGRSDEAAAIMKKALPIGSMLDIHQYGRQLLALKKSKEALEVFKSNFQKYPNQFTTLMGLVRGHSANGDYKSALKFAQQALPLAPDNNNKNNVENMIEKLKEGKDVNS
jgi:tetratricopeptide (TPR) repeat protein